MARFTGTGAFTITGSEARLHDLEFDNSGGVTLSASTGFMRECRVGGDLTLTASRTSVFQCQLAEVTWSGDYGDLSGCVVTGAVEWSGDYGMLSNSLLSNPVGITGAQHHFTDNRADYAGSFLDITADDAVVVGNVFEVTAGDMVTITGDRNQVMTNRFIPGGSVDTAVTLVSGECNMVVGNDLGDSDDYATDAIDDSAANTQLFWPADATYGDNFTDCGSGS